MRVGHLAQWLAYLHPDPSAPGLISTSLKKFSEEIFFDVADVNQRHCLGGREQWLENVY